MEIIKSYIWPRSGIWQLEYHAMFEDGKVVKKIMSTKVKTSEQTLAFMVGKYMPAKLAELQNSTAVKEIGRFTFGYWCEKYIKVQRGLVTLDKTETRTKAALEYFGEYTDIRHIKKDRVREYISDISQRPGKHGRLLHRDTVKSYLYQLNGIMQLAVDAEIILRNPADGIKLNIKSVSDSNAVRPFKATEVEKLLNGSKNDLRNYLGIAFNTGMSPEEIIALMPSDFDFENRKIKIQRVITHGQLRQETKTVYRTREIPMFLESVAYITNQIEIAKKRHSMFIFCTEDGQRLNDITDLRGQKKNNTKWYGLLNDCDIEYRPLKNCRHTFAVQAIMSKKFTLQEIANILGHATLRMLIQHYAKWIEGAAADVDANISIYESKKKNASNTSFQHSKKIG